MPPMPGNESSPLQQVQRRFREFATQYADLPLYGAICAQVAQDDETASLLRAAAPGQDRPVLWLAALHELVLRQPDLPAARWFPSVIPSPERPEGDPWPDVRRTVLDHRAELTATIAARRVQTNEVNRSVYLAAALATVCADLPDHPVALVEMGASAGLLLGLDRYRVEMRSPARTTVLGDPASPVVCAGVDRSPATTEPLRLPPIVGRAGIDVHPVRLDDSDGLRWLEACLWPDVPGRVERFRAAVARLAETPPVVVEGDMVSDLRIAVAAAREGRPEAHLVAFSSWALTYVERSRRAEVPSTLAALAAGGTPVTWLTAEPPGCVPGLEGATANLEAGTVLAVRRWRDGVELEPQVLGTCHQHGAWVDLSPPV